MKTLDSLTITTWAYEGLHSIEQIERSWSTIFWALVVPLMMAFAFMMLAYTVMRMRLPGPENTPTKATP